MKKFSFLLMGISSLLLLGCEKPEPACYLSEPTLTVNGETAADETIVVSILDNGNINLAAPLTDGFDVHWSGPNGFESDEVNAVVPNATSASSGEYKLKISKGICSSEKTANIEVQAVSAPCTPQNNMLTFTEGYTPVTFSSIHTSTNTGAFEITANGNIGDMTIEFVSEAAPETGVYTISTDCPTSFLNAGEVCMSLVYSGAYCVPGGGEVYITKQANGKYIVLFCDLLFRQAGDLPELRGSAKITQP